MKYEYSSVIPIIVLAYVVFPLLILSGIRKIYIKKVKPSQEFFAKDETTILKGICIMIVMFTHYGNRMKPQSLMYWYNMFGYLSVSIFLLISGYAMYIQYQKKQKAFFEHFLINRCFRMLFPFVVISVVMSLVNRIPLIKFCYNLITLQIPRGKDETFGVTWFLVAMLFFSICFYFCFKYMKEKQALLVMVVLSALYMIVCIGLKCGVWWYDNSFCFAIGIILARYRQKVLEFMEKLKIPVFLLSGLAIGVFVLLMGKRGMNENIVVLTACGFCAIACIVSLFNMITMKSRMFTVIGNMSWEVFLVHSTVQISIYGEKVQQPGYSIIFVIIVVLIVSCLIYRIDNYATQLFCKYGKRKEGI
ncbi:MAG: acyltransferase [Lachnospiraceae bacterium]|nr:acyltransferase [Lachnospiraceae bacterium]